MIGTDKIFQGQRLEEQTFFEVIKALKKQVPYSSLINLYISFDEISDEQSQQIAEALQVDNNFEYLSLELKGLSPSRQNELMVAIVASDSLKTVSLNFGDQYYSSKEKISEALAPKMSEKLSEVLDDANPSLDDIGATGLWHQVAGEFTSLYNSSKSAIQSYLPDVSDLKAACTACLPTTLPKPKME